MSVDRESLGREITDIVSAIISNLASADFSESFDAIGDMLAKEHTRYFQEQEDPNGVKWKPLSSRAIDSRWLRQLGGGQVGSGVEGKKREQEFLNAGFSPDSTILIDSGALRISLSYRGSPHHVEDHTPLTYEFGTDLEYASVHQLGLETQTYDERQERWLTVEVPARPMVGWNKFAIKQAVNIIADDAVKMAVSGIGV